MDLGLIFVGNGLLVRDLSAIGVRAEANGFTTLAMAEAWRSGWVPLTAMAAATSSIGLATYVLNAYGHSPLMTGMAAIDFNEYCGGRLALGIGGGNRIINEQWQGIAHARVLTKMREYVTVLKIMARTRLGESMKFDGQIHSMEWSPAVDPGQQPYPVYLAAVFPSMMTVAAQVADGIGAGATLSPAYLRDVLKPQAAEAARKVGRDPATLGWKAVGVIAADDDRERARRAAREAIWHLYSPLPHPYYEFTMREQGFGKVADTLIKLAPGGNLEAAVDAIPDDCLDCIAIAGTPAECRVRLTAYEGVIDEILLLNALPPAPGQALAAYTGLLSLGPTSGA